MTRKLTTLKHIQDVDCDCSRWKTCATLLERGQIADFKLHGIRAWSDFPPDRFVWITDGGRFLAIGEMPSHGFLRGQYKLKKGERLVRIDLKFWGAGCLLKLEAENYLRKLDVQLAKKKPIAKKKAKRKTAKPSTDKQARKRRAAFKAAA